MRTLRPMPSRGGLRRIIVLACLTAALWANASSALAADASGSRPDIWGNLPGALVLGIPLAIGLALYVSRALGRGERARDSVRREGAVSRALLRRGGSRDDTR